MGDLQRGKRAAGAVTTSLMVHAGLLVTFAAIRWGVLPETPHETVAAGFATEDALQTVVTLPEVNPEPTEQSGGATAAPIIDDASEAPLPITTVVDAPMVTEPVATEARPEAKTVAASASTGEGQGNATGNGTGRGGAFFDLEAAGDRVVYVVDCSKSMNRPYPSPERTRFGRVKRELISSIKSLQPEQKYFVIYFNTEAHPMPARRLIERSSYDTMNYLRWLAAFKTDGRTNPEPALMLALSLKPDAVFFLTDGDFRANVVDSVVKANLRRTPVHTIGFGDDVQAEESPAVDVLSGLASRTGGQLSLIGDNGQVVRR